jgi:hypothetical protein
MSTSPTLSFYSTPGPMTDPGEYAPLLKDLPTSLPELVQALQGLAVHIFWAERYGLKLSDERQAEVNLRPLRRRLARMRELDPAPLTQARPYERRLVSNCRDFSTMITGLLIWQGVPARARCGFGTYFTPNRFEDHWVVEYWHASEKRWVRFDPQIDDLMKEKLGLRFDPLDMGTEPNSWFVPGGEAWLMCRREGANPEHFGIFQWHGWNFIKSDLIRDLLALNKVEILPWDFWPGMGKQCPEEFAPADWEKLDRLAELTMQPDANFEQIRAWFESDPALQVPAEWLE